MPLLYVHQITHCSSERAGEWVYQMPLKALPSQDSLGAGNDNPTLASTFQQEPMRQALSRWDKGYVVSMRMWCLKCPKKRECSAGKSFDLCTHYQ